MNNDDRVLVFRAVGPARMVVATVRLFIEGRGNWTVQEIVDRNAMIAEEKAWREPSDQ